MSVKDIVEKWYTYQLKHFGLISDSCEFVLNEENKSCNKMCLLSEWDENKPRDCENCSGRTK